MFRRSRLTHIASWIAVLVLVLKAAVPMFAAGAAQLRGVSVAEVCTVYGVALPGMPGGEHVGHGHHHHADQDDHASHSTSAHTGDHCALTALGAFAAAEHAAWEMPRAQAPAAGLASASLTHGFDRSARWTARRKHGPPALA